MTYKVDGKAIVRPDGTFLGAGRSNAEAKLIANQLNAYETRIEFLHAHPVSIEPVKSTSEVPLIDYLKKVIPPQAKIIGV